MNRTKVELRKNDRLPIQYVNGVPSFTAKNLKAIPLFSEFDDEILNRLVSSFETKEVDVDKFFVEEGKDNISVKQIYWMNRNLPSASAPSLPPYSLG